MEACHDLAFADEDDDGEGWRARVADALTAGSSACSNPAGTGCSICGRQLTAEIFNVVRTEFPAERYAGAEGRAARSGRGAVRGLETKANEIAIVSLDGPTRAPDDALAGARLLEGRNLDRCRAHRCGERSRVTARHLAMIERNRPTIVTEAVVENHEAGLL
jgi:hypothetical protein